MDYTETYVSIPHRYGTTYIIKKVPYTTVQYVSIPHRYGTTNNGVINDLRTFKQVSIPHRYGTTIWLKMEKSWKKQSQFLIGTVLRITQKLM